MRHLHERRWLRLQRRLQWRLFSVALPRHDVVVDGGSDGVLLHILHLLEEIVISSHPLLLMCCHFVGYGAWRAVASVTLLPLRHRVTHGAEAAWQWRGRA